MDEEESSSSQGQASNIRSLPIGTSAINPSKRRIFGTVVWFSAEKGLGFIKIDNSNDEIFVHVSAIRDADKSLVQGQRVSLELEEIPKTRYVVVDEARLEYERSKLLNRIDRIVLTIEGLSAPDDFRPLTPNLLVQTVGPYLGAIANLQNIINEIHNISNDVTLVSIQHKSPVTVDLKGASEAITIIRDTIVPWRRKHQKKLSQLAIEEKRAEIKSKQVDILGKEARIEREKTEVVKSREEAEGMRLKNEKVRLEISRAKVQLAIDILAQIAPLISEAERISYIVKLLPALDIILQSEVQIRID